MVKRSSILILSLFVLLSVSNSLASDPPLHRIHTVEWYLNLVEHDLKNSSRAKICLDLGLLIGHARQLNENSVYLTAFPLQGYCDATVMGNVYAGRVKSKNKKQFQTGLDLLKQRLKDLRDRLNQGNY